jgi:hypothetical protein
LCASSPSLFFLGWKKGGRKKKKKEEEFRKNKKKVRTKNERVTRTYREKKNNLFPLISCVCNLHKNCSRCSLRLSLSLFSAERGARDTSTFLSLNLHRAARVLRKTRVFIKEEREDDDAA